MKAGSQDRPILVVAKIFKNGAFTLSTILVDGGRIARIFEGAPPADGEYSKPPMLLDAGDLWLLPSFTDAHVHLTCMARRMDGADLSACTTARQVLYELDALRSEGRYDDAWLVGWSFNPAVIEGPPLDKDMLDRRFPRVPVLVKNIDLHSCLVNRAAAHRLGIGDDSADPEGGRLGRSADGRFDGRLFETAFWLAEERLPAPPDERLESLLSEAAAMLNRRGVTAVLSFDGEREFELLRRMHERGDGPSLRVMTSLREEDLDGLEVPPPEIPPDRAWLAPASPEAGVGRAAGLLARGPLKLFVDGSLGSGTAWMEEDYLGRPGYKGLVVTGRERLERLAAAADRAGRPLAVHAIGSRANRTAVEVFESLPPGSCARLRHRIEHAQFLPPGLAERISACGLSATTLPAHLPFDVPNVLRLLGPSPASRLHPLASLLRSDVRFALTSDAPVAPCDPLQSLRLAVERPAGEDGPFHAEQSIEPLHALEAITVNAAWLLFGEDRWGRIAEGLAADFVLLSSNPLSMRERPRVSAVFFEGRPVHDPGGIAEGAVEGT